MAVETVTVMFTDAVGSTELPEGAGYSSLFEFYLGDDAGVDAVLRRTRRRRLPRPDGAGADPGPVRRDGRRPRRARDLADL